LFDLFFPKRFLEIRQHAPVLQWLLRVSISLRFSFGREVGWVWPSSEHTFNLVMSCRLFRVGVRAAPGVGDSASLWLPDTCLGLRRGLGLGLRLGIGLGLRRGLGLGLGLGSLMKSFIQVGTSKIVRLTADEERRPLRGRTAPSRPLHGRTARTASPQSPTACNAVNAVLWGALLL
jgi:hypothetical protein